MAAPGALTAGATLASGLLGNKGAQHAANAAAGDRHKLVARQSALFDKMFGAVEAADQGGQFNADHRIATASADSTHDLDVAQRIASGDAMNAGYHAGDSVLQQQKQGITTNFLRSMASMRDSMKQQSFWDKLNAYKSVDPGMLNPGIQSDTYDEQAAYGRMQNPAGFIGSASSLFPPVRPGGGGPRSPGAGTGAPPPINIPRFDPNLNSFNSYRAMPGWGR